MTKEIKPSRKCPFHPGKKYRVKKTFQAYRDSFKQDEVLIFSKDAWSRYESMTGYFFAQPNSSALKSWDIADDENLDNWIELFEEIN